MNKIICFISLLLVFSFTAVEGQNLQQLGYYNVNGIHAMSSKANYIILGNGSIVDISDPASPTLKGSLSLSAFSTSVLVSENYAYFGTGMDVNLIIADIADEAFPLKKSTINFPNSGGGIFGLAKSNNTLFLAMGSEGVYSVDITNKANPIVLDSIIIPNGQARDIAVKDNYVYVAHVDGLKVIDITNPSNINVISTIGSGYYSIDIDLINNKAFLGKSSGGVDVFNISNPSAPSPAFAVPNGSGSAWDVKYSNNLLFVATNSSGLFVYKITGNSATETSHFPNTGNGQSFSVALQDSLILLSGLINGVAILHSDSLYIMGVENDIISDQLIIFPNPAGDHIKFSNNILPGDEIEILNTEGRSFLKVQYHQPTNRIDISGLPAGAYIVQFKNAKGVLLERIIKVE
jgi:hypothetical protein